MNRIQPMLLPQIAMGGIETVFNYLIDCSPQVLPILHKLVGKNLKITLKQPHFTFIVVFSQMRTDWLSQYEGEVDCAICMEAITLPQLANKTKLSELINNQSLILEGDLQILQYFSMLLDELEADPAELLSHFIGDVPAQFSTQLAKRLSMHIKKQWTQDSQNIVENLMVERPVLVHRLQLVDFCDQVDELAQKVVKLEQKLAQLGI